jgi:G protein-coupled receptor GPR1
MSLHMYLQIFSTGSKIFGHDGLYRFRHTVMAGWFTFPFLCAVLAFIRGREGYIAQGPFCTLPIRPYRYRLALQWIPRYLIWFFIMFVAVSIYLHVGQGFKIFAREDNNDTSTETNDYGQSMGTMPGEGLQQLQMPKTRGANAGELQDLSGLMDSNASAGQAPTSSSSRGSQSTWPTSLNSSAEGLKLHSTGHSRRSSHVANPADGNTQHELLQVPPELKQQRQSISTIQSWRISADMTSAAPVNLGTINEGQQMMSGDKQDIASADTPLKKRRRAIQRQMRLLFIYPVTYLMVWTIPFVYHSFNYSDKYAAHPIPILALLSTFCLTIAGTVDCVVFGWREKPWQHVPGADGTFLGSFKFWSFYGRRRRWATPAPKRLPSLDRDEEEAVGQADQNSKQATHPSGASRLAPIPGSNKPMVHMHKKTFSGTSDRATRAADQAAERLALERADRQSRMSTRNSSMANNEWFERRLSACVSPTREDFAFDLTPTPSPTKEDHTEK